MRHKTGLLHANPCPALSLPRHTVGAGGSLLVPLPGAEGVQTWESTTTTGRAPHIEGAAEYCCHCYSFYASLLTVCVPELLDFSLPPPPPPLASMPG